MIDPRRVVRTRLSRGTIAVTLALLGAAPARAERPRVYALTGGRVVVAPGKTIENGTVVLRDGLIEAVGASITPPPDAVVVDVTGKTVHAGFIDACSEAGLKTEGSGGAGGGAASEGPGTGAGRARSAPARPRAIQHSVATIQPERRAVDLLDPQEKDFEKRRGLGFTVAAVFPPGGIFRGTAAVISLTDRPLPRAVLREEAAQVIGFDHGDWGDPYPGSLMGAIAAIRQGFEDARRHAVWQARWEADPRGLPRPDAVSAWEPLARVVNGEVPVIFDATTPNDTLRAASLAAEFGLDARIVGSGVDAEVLDGVRRSGRTIIVSLAFPEKPEVSEAEDALDVETRDLERYLAARATPARFAEARIPFAFATCRMKSLSDVPANLRRALDAGLSEADALAALTTVPARLYGLDRALGTLEPGKAADVVVEDGPLFAEKTKPAIVYVDGDEFRIEEKKPKGDPHAVVDPRGEWSVTLSFGERTVTRAWTISGSPGSWSGVAETRSGGTTPFAAVHLEGNELTLSLPDESGGRSEITVIIRGDELEGTGESARGTSFSIRGTRTAPPSEKSL